MCLCGGGRLQERQSMGRIVACWWVCGRPCRRTLYNSCDVCVSLQLQQNKKLQNVNRYVYITMWVESELVIEQMWELSMKTYMCSLNYFCKFAANLNDFKIIKSTFEKHPHSSNHKTCISTIKWQTAGRLCIQEFCCPGRLFSVANL